MFKSISKENVAAANAKKAWDEGRRFYLYEAGSPLSSAVMGVAEALEAVEAIGWRLEHMSHVWSTTMGNHTIGYYLFRRPE